jgi:hypothetical protein
MLRLPQNEVSIALAASAMLVSLLASPAPLLAANEPTPLFVVEGPLFEIGPPGSTEMPTDVWLALFVMPNGEVVETVFWWHLPSPFTVVSKGPVTGTLFEELRSTLNLARPGIQTDCSFDASDLFTSFTTETVSLDWRITWFGRQRRHNVFHVATGVAFPKCPQPVVNLARSIFNFRAQFGALPTTQILDSFGH